MDSYSISRAFIASPGDVEDERRLAEEIIGYINRIVRDTLSVTIDVIKWENLPPLTPNLPEETFQDKLNIEIEKCNFFILILNKRYGTIHPNYSISNTEREIETIFNLHERKPNRKILTYFRDLENNPDPGEQEDKVRKLRKRLEEKGLAYKTYSDPSAFSKLLTHDLYDVLLRMHLSPYKKAALKRFWRFGDTSQTMEPRTAIVYPPVERYGTAIGGDSDYWIKRLNNQIAFEDYKALQKIESNIRLVDNRGDYRVYPQTDVPADIQVMNRVFLCVPRNKLGLSELQKTNCLRFSYSPLKNRPQLLTWKTNKGHKFNIQSPMSVYLEKQRKTMKISGDWHGELGRIIVKDFAVLARIKREEVGIENYLWDYYFAGIRGLGTWGAAWYVDREYKKFFSYNDEENIELLLEVTYRDRRILKVVDVSDKPPSYFKNENKISVIDTNIELYKEQRY